MNLTQWLFDTDALRLCPENSPFWYTSGTIGPYYINTHFLCGGEPTAASLLACIDGALAADRAACPRTVGEALEAELAKGGIFSHVIDALIAAIREIGLLNGVGFISGGERRDWFFSLPVAKRLGLPHITLFKDLSAVVTTADTYAPVPLVAGASVLHIADLITEASSYERAWVPALEALGCRMAASCVVVDRLQGGGDKLAALGVRHHALAAIDRSLFDAALAQGLISAAQRDMVADYLADPHAAMRGFLVSHPAFMREALAADAKTAARAELCLDKDFYGVASLFR